MERMQDRGLHVYTSSSNDSILLIHVVSSHIHVKENRIISLELTLARSWKGPANTSSHTPTRRYAYIYVDMYALIYQQNMHSICVYTVLKHEVVRHTYRSPGKTDTRGGG